MNRFFLNVLGKRMVRNFSMLLITLVFSVLPAKAGPVSASVSDGQWYFNIATVEDLVWFRDYVNRGHKRANARLIADIDLSEVCNQSDGTSWIPIAFSSKYSEISMWYGTFDGNGKKISGLFIDNCSLVTTGLFGFNGGTIKDLTVEGTIISDNSFYGGIAVYSRGKISNCYSEINVVSRTSKLFNNKISGIL